MTDRWTGSAGTWSRPSRSNYCWHAFQGFADWELREVIAIDGEPPFVDIGRSVRLPTLAACKQIAAAIDDAREAGRG